MIRRDATLPDGSPAWALIPQTAHARIAGEIAELWGAGGFLPLCHRSVVLPTIFRHDDGWRQWEASPGVDPQTGRPLQFLEMPPEEANRIWRQSIDRVADLGPLAQYLVARHFVLLRQASDSPETQARKAFIDEFAERCRQWLAAWQREDPARHRPETADLAMAQLRFFDALSLRICCGDLTQPDSMSTPSGKTIRLAPSPQSGPRPAPHADMPHVEVSPWPLRAESLELRARARLMPAARYNGDKALPPGDGQDRQYVWRLVPADGGP